MSPAAGWHVIANASDDEALDILSRDRVWNCFAIADLDEPFRRDTTISIARSGPEAASLMVLDRPDIQVVSPAGHADGVAAILGQVRLPPAAFVQCQTEHRDLMATYFPTADWQELIRMTISPGNLDPSAASLPNGFEMAALDISNAGELRALYGEMARGPFPDEQLVHGRFVGVRAQGHVVSVAGTHVVSRRFGVAVIGGVLTDPAFRRRGLARFATTQLTRILFDDGCDLVALNVLTANGGAVELYRELGFDQNCRFWSAVVGHADPSNSSTHTQSPASGGPRFETGSQA